MKHLIYFFTLCVFALFVINDADAQVPKKISYQGLLTTSAGTPVPDGSYNLTFKIFDVSTGGSALWTENQTGITVQRGTFNVFLGSVTTLNISFNKTLYVEVTATSGPGIPSPVTFSPRSELTSSPYSFSVIGTQCEATGLYSTAGGRNNRARGNYSVVGGGGDASLADSNSARGDYSTISGGKTNLALDNYSTVSGGSFNTAQEYFTTIGGGNSNRATAWAATVSGGISNLAYSHYTTIAGGGMNESRGNYSAIVGGRGNYTSGDSSFIGGGGSNTASGRASVVTGGSYGRARGWYSFIGGGGGETIIDSNSALGDWSVISGGKKNKAEGHGSTISGGQNNYAAGNRASIGGGEGHNVSGNNATINGGYNNSAAGTYSAVGGGYVNSASAYGAVVGGGTDNTASGMRATVAGGWGNRASEERSTIGGGYNNIASGLNSTIPGGRDNVALGSYSFAAGRQAKANHDGAFVWADNTVADFASSAINQFNVRASGGTRIFSNAGLTAGVTLAAGASAWAAVSDSSLKRNKRLVDSKEIMGKVAQLPIMRWSYLSQDPSIEHIGPMAQDFYAIFGLGEDEKTISTIDPAGVALAAIQGLIQENKELRTKNEELSARLNQLEIIVQSLVEEKSAEGGSTENSAKGGCDFGTKSLGELR